MVGVGYIDEKEDNTDLHIDLNLENLLLRRSAVGI
jgi:hypothetical protein